MTDEKYVIGVDCGTTNVKAVAYNLIGDEVSVSSSPNQVIQYNGICNEQDMEALWKSCASCIKTLLEENPFLEGKIEAIGVSGQGEGLWVLDKEGKPFMNAILWNDGRAYPTTDALKANNELYVKIKKSNATYLKNGSTLSILKYVFDNDRNSYDKIGYIFSCKDWIRYRLTGNINWEYTDASCSCIEIEKKEYSEDIFKELGLNDLMTKLPPLISAKDKGGEVTEEASKETGLPVGLPVSGGMLDLVSSATGLGVVKTNQSSTIIGTTGMTLSIVDKYVADEEFNGWELHMDGNSFIKGMGCMAAAPNLDWILDRLFPNKDVKEVYAEIETTLKDRLPGSCGLIYHPHISLAGERAPFFDGNATASFLGLRADTTSMDMVQAVLEGVVLSLKDCYKGVPLSNVTVTGGASKNNVWMQMFSDALGVPVTVQMANELSAKGAALSAAIMTGAIKDLNNRDFFKVKKEFLPDPKRHELFEELYENYKNTQRKMKDFWDWRFKYKQKLQNISKEGNK
ncbi:MAG: carbohydrate kinase [Sphaerochaetaceae bacterium]|nr:carbohydrate kinase [Sphaerochaetaceae bacterium]